MRYQSDSEPEGWVRAFILLGLGALLVVPMGDGDNEAGFFVVAGAAAVYWLVQCVVALFERGWRSARQPLFLVKLALIALIAIAALVRGHFVRVAAFSLTGGLLVVAVGGIGAGIVYLVRLVEERLRARKRG